jgi:hypothetical protein
VDVTAVRQAIAAALTGYPGLEGGAFAYLPDSLEPPAAVVGLPGRITYATTMGRDTLEVGVILLAGRTSDEGAQQTLDNLVARSAVKAALEADRTLGGVCASLQVVEARDWAPVDVAGGAYLAATLALTITG